MKKLFLAGIAVALAACTPHALQTETLRQAFLDKEECESEASTATGMYQAGVSDGRTWLDIKNDCLRRRMAAK